MRIIFFLFVSSSFLFSCASSPVNVVVDRSMFEDSSEKQVHLIVFDGKDSVMLSDSAVTVKLFPGKHSFVLDKAAAKEFVVGSKGGILNLDNKEYIAFEVEYESKGLLDNSNLNIRGRGLKAVVLMDSFVIIPKHGIAIQSDSAIRNILPKLLQAKNGNYAGWGKQISDYDTNESIYGIKKFGKDQLFINKFWDYDLNQDIPESVEIRTSKSSYGTETTTKSAVFPAKVFLLFARISSEEYTVKTLEEIRLGTNDAIHKKENEKQQKEKEKKQLKF